VTLRQRQHFRGVTSNLAEVQTVEANLNAAMMGDDVVVVERRMGGVDEVLVSGPGDATVDVDLAGDQVDLQ